MLLRVVWHGPLLSGAALTQTHTHKDLVNVMVRNNVLEIMFTKSLRVWVWVSVAPLNCQTKQNKLDKWDRPWELRAFQGRSEGEISNDSRIRGPAAV